MLDTLASIEDRYDEIERLLADPEISADYSRVQSLAKEHASLKNVATLITRSNQMKVLAFASLSDRKFERPNFFLMVAGIDAVS